MFSGLFNEYLRRHSVKYTVAIELGVIVVLLGEAFVHVGAWQVVVKAATAGVFATLFFAVEVGLVPVEVHEEATVVATLGDYAGLVVNLEADFAGTAFLTPSARLSAEVVSEFALLFTDAMWIFGHLSAFGGGNHVDAFAKNNLSAAMRYAAHLARHRLIHIVGFALAMLCSVHFDSETNPLLVALRTTNLGRWAF